MTPREIAKRLFPPLLLDAARAARHALHPDAPAGEATWRDVRGGVLAGHALRLPASREAWVDAMLGGAYEPVFAAAVTATVRPGDVCYDLGAHIGYYSLVMALRAGPGGAVHAFEPYAPNAARLREHAARNADPSARAPIHVHSCALADETGERALVGAGDGDAVSTLSHLDGARGVLDPAWRTRFGAFPRQAVPVWRLDDWRAHTGAPPPDLLKVDVEGSELAVLHGARGTLAATRPVVLAELHNAGLAAECGAFLGGLGYTVQVVACETGADCIVRATHAR
ncbi:MAG TPA: FkbM family methyltransferase [Longimicrobium sp.]|nr:FkbM family methyltransferase [Longimicrobium sp.]